MRDQLLHLIHVQRIDSEIARLIRSFQDSPQRLKQEHEKLLVARREVQEIEQEIQLLQDEYRRLESEHKMEAHKLKKWESRLNEIRNQREYIALSREIDSAKRQNKDVEDRILDLMQTVEEKGKLIETLRDDLAVQEVDYEQMCNEVDDQGQQIEAEKVSLIEERDRRLVGLPAPLVKRYEKIRDRRLGLGIAAVRDGTCQGCHMGLPPQLYNILLRANSLESCPNCHRMIYWEGLVEEEESKNAAKEETPQESAASTG